MFRSFGAGPTYKPWNTIRWFLKRAAVELHVHNDFGVHLLIFTALKCKKTLFCNSMERQPHLGIPERHLFALIYNQNFILVLSTLPDLTFYTLPWFHAKMTDLGNPIGSKMVSKSAKMTFKQLSGAQRGPDSRNAKTSRNARWIGPQCLSMFFGVGTLQFQLHNN